MVEGELDTVIKILDLHQKSLQNIKTILFKIARILSSLTNNKTLPKETRKLLRSVTDELFLIWFKLDVNDSWAVDTVLYILEKLKYSLRQNFR